MGEASETTTSIRGPACGEFRDLARVPQQYIPATPDGPLGSHLVRSESRSPAAVEVEPLKACVPDKLPAQVPQRRCGRLPPRRRQNREKFIRNIERHLCHNLRITQQRHRVERVGFVQLQIVRLSASLHRIRRGPVQNYKKDTIPKPSA
jgi:hypothetical protein